jgi:hypothetical protein
MREKEIISQLNILKSIKPEESWVIESRNRVLSKAPCFGWTVIELDRERGHIVDNKSSILSRFMSFAGNRAAVAFMSFVILFVGGALIVNASKSSLPGDSLYPVKIASEKVILAVASEEEKAKIEIEQAGKRLEELAVISWKTSDLEQQQKVDQLIVDFEVKINSANKHLTKIDNNSEKAKIAKVINDQSGKYVEILAKTTENLPTSLKEKVSDKLAKAIDSTEKINLSSLMVMVENKNLENSDVISSEEVKFKLKEAIKREKNLEMRTVGDKEAVESASSSGSGLEGNSFQEKEIESEPKNSLDNDNADTSIWSTDINDAVQSQERVKEKTKDELLTDAEASLESFEETNDNNDLLNAVKNIVAAKEIGNDEKINLEIMPLPVFDEEFKASESSSSNN